MKSEIFFVSDFNSETGNRLDVPTSGLNLVLTFILFFKFNYLQKINPDQSIYLTRLSHTYCHTLMFACADARMRIGMIRTPCGYHHSILMGNRPPSNLTGHMRMPIRHHRPQCHALPSPHHHPWGRAAQGRRATRIGTGDTRMCAWQRRAWLAPCGLCCAGTPGLLHSQAARRWLALRLLPSPRPPCPFDPPRRL